MLEVISINARVVRIDEMSLVPLNFHSSTMVDIILQMWENKMMDVGKQSEAREQSTKFEQNLTVAVF